MPPNRAKLINLRPNDRLGQVNTYDGQNNTANCEFSFTKPIELESEGAVGLRSAFIPITYKNVIEGYNDRFYIRFRPDTSTAESQCVFVTVQIKAGQYDTLTAYAAAINTTLQTLSSTTPTTLTAAGGVSYTFTDDTDAVLSAGAMTCVVSTDSASKHHLDFGLANGVKFASTSVVDKTGTNVVSTSMAGGFQIAFGLASGSETKIHEAETRQASRFIGFGHEYAKSIDGDSYPSFPVVPVARVSDAVVSVISPTVGSVLFTPYIYVRSSLVSDAVETTPQGTKTSNLLAKIPVTSSGYGDAIFFEPDGETMFFKISAGSIQNVKIQLTDNNGRELPLLESDWEIALVVRGNIYS